MKFDVKSTSSGGGGGWRNAYGGTIEGEAAKVKAHLPSGVQSVDVEFDLFELPMPGSSLVD